MKHQATAFMFLLFLSGLITGTVLGQSDPSVTIHRLTAEISTATGDSLKIEKLGALAWFYNDYLDDPAHADSLCDLAILTAEAGHRPEMFLLACDRFIGSCDLHKNYHKALELALKADQVTATLNNPGAAYVASKNLAIVYLAGYQYDKALEYNYRSLSLAGTSENNLQKAGCYLAIGQSLEGKNQKIEAFRNYITASSLAEKEANDELLKSCYNRISDFYNLNKLYAKATRYKLMQRDLVRKKIPADSLALMWMEYDLQVIDLNSNENRLNEQNVSRVLEFASRTGNQRLMNYEIALYRSHLIGANKIGNLKDLYLKRFPREWAKLEKSDPAMCYRMKAIFSEYDGHADSALWNYGKADQALEGEPNKVLRSKFYDRYADFFMRQGHLKEALVMYNRSYSMAAQASYFEYMVNASRKLASLYAATGDYKNAYDFAQLHKSLSDSISNLSRQDQILVMELEHETWQHERLAEREQQEMLRRHSLQYTGITIGIFSAFIFLIMLGSLKVPEWIIKMLGFFSFIFLFEFIILLADHKIHELTAGEPWKVLLIKIFLIAILLPLHHEIEKIVVTYLLNHKLLDLKHLSLLKRFRDQAGKRRMKNDGSG